MTPEARHANAHWDFLLLGWFLTGIAFPALFIGTALLFRSGDRTPSLLWGLIFGGIAANGVGTWLRLLGRYMKQTTANHEELAKLVTEQAQRIRKLEEQLAALTANPAR